MNAGLIHYDSGYFAMRLNPTGSESGGGTVVAQVQSHYQSFLVTQAVGISLKATLTHLGWEVDCTVPDFSESYNSVGDLGWLGSGDCEVRLYTTVYAKKLDYVDGFGNPQTLRWWKLKDATVKVYVGGSLRQTWALGDIVSLYGFGTIDLGVPSCIPLIGIAPVIGSVSTVPVPDGPGSFTNTASGNVTGGWRWSDIGARPVNLQPQISPPGGCSGSPTLPSISVSDTWNGYCESYASAIGTSTTIATTLGSSSISLWNQEARSWKRIGNDFKMLVLRYDVPGAQMYGETVCTDWLPPADPVVTTYPVYATVLTPRAQMLASVGKAPHAFEDVLNDDPPCPYFKTGSVGLQTFSGGLLVHSTGRKDTSELTGCFGTIGVGALISDPYTEYWDCCFNPHWSHKGFFKDLVVDGSSVDAIDYESMVDEQWLYHAALVIGERTKTRNHIQLNGTQGDPYWHERIYGHGIRNLGVSRWQTYSPTLWTSYAYDSSSSGLWTFTDATCAFGASMVVTANVGKSSWVGKLKLGSYTDALFQAVHLAEQFKFAWVSTNISAIKWYIVGIDGTKLDLGAVSGTWVDKLRSTSTEFAGSYGIDNGCGVVSDTGADIGGAGISTPTMADPERCAAFELLPGSSGVYLQVEVTLTGTGLASTHSYPEARRSSTEKPAVACESGHAFSYLWADNAGIRFGNHGWWNAGGSSVYVTPTVNGICHQTSVLDGRCWAKEFLEGLDRTDGLTAWLTGLYDAEEGRTAEDAAFDTYMSPLPHKDCPGLDGGDGTLIQTLPMFALVNLIGECPPLCLVPRKARDADYVENGGYRLETWSWAKETAEGANPGSTPYETWVSGVKWSTTLSGSPSGWSRSGLKHPTDNNESGTVRLAGVDKADVRPWRQWFFSDGKSSEGGGVANAHDPWNPYFRAFVKDGDIFIARADGPRPPSFDFFQVTATGDNSDPGITVDDQRNVWLVWQRGTDVRYAVSYDDGQSFEDKGVLMATAYFPRVRAGEWGRMVAGAFYYNSGTSGPGKIHVRYKGPGDSAFGTAVVAPFDVEPNGFDFTFAPNGANSIILTAVKSGDTDPNEWESTDDEDLTWNPL